MDKYAKALIPVGIFAMRITNSTILVRREVAFSG
jgi:hypothetical protein